jgi:hypothetical protein
MANYTITSKESKNTALSELENATKWIELKSDVVNAKFAQVLPFIKLCNESLKRKLKAQDAITAILKSLPDVTPKPIKIGGDTGAGVGLLGQGKGLSFKEAMNLSENYYVLGSTDATVLFSETFHCGKDIIAKINEEKIATDVIKEKIEKIDSIRSIHCFDKEGNLIW